MTAPDDGEHPGSERGLIDAALREVEVASAPRERPPDAASSPVVESLRAAGYRVIRELHRGGQGVVYEAFQERTGRTVAIKVLREGPVADADERARFELEVRILARLKHPNIVTIHDSGETAGFYFIVMDYVRGEALDAYVLNEEPDARAILELFATIAEAVAVAHRNGIIHRDLKPSNVRVDETHSPKVLDFGLAKVADPQSTISGGITHTGQFLGSIPWASPEQADARNDLIDVRTDVYALGVMLFQMLTRRFPYDVTASIREVLQNIVRVDPPRPSSIRRELDDEIDTIVLKALSKEPGRRYQTAHDLAGDIRRYLAGEPIRAKSDSTAYVLRKLLRRHRVPIAVASGFVAVAAGGGIVAAVLHGRNVEMRRQSIYSESDFFRDLLESVNPQGIELPAEKVREKLADATRRLNTELAGLPEARANLQHAIGVTYRRIGMFGEAEEQLGAALGTRQQLYQPPNAKIAETLHELGAVNWHNAQFGIAERYYRDARAQRLALFGEQDTRYADTLNHLAACVCSQGEVEEAERLYHQALEIRRTLLGSEHAEVAATLNNLASCLNRGGQHREAIGYVRQAIDMMTNLHGEQHPFVARGMTNLSGYLIEIGEAAEADDILKTALRIKRQTAGPKHPSVATTLHRLAALKLDEGDAETARPFIDEALAVRRAALRGGHPDIAASLLLAGRVRLAQGDASGAEPLLDETLHLHAELYPRSEPRHIEAVLAYAECEIDLGRLSSARSRLTEQMKLHRTWGVMDSDATRRLHALLERTADGGP